MENNLDERTIDSLLRDYDALFHGDINSWFSAEAKGLYYKLKSEAVLTPSSLDDYSLLALAITLADTDNKNLSSDLFGKIKKDLEIASFTSDFLKLFDFTKGNKKMLLNDYKAVYDSLFDKLDKSEGVESNLDKALNEAEGVESNE